MHVIATPPEVTPDDLLRMPDDGRSYELVDGRPVELNVSAKSSRVGGRLYRRLDEYADAHGGFAFPAETMFLCFPTAPRTVRKPDAAFIAPDRYTADQYETEGQITVCPDVVAEVVSPNDVMAEVTVKRLEWLAAGVKLVWVVDPVDQSVAAYVPGGPVRVFQAADTLTGDPVLPGFACPVADLFRLPTPPAATVP